MRVSKRWLWLIPVMLVLALIGFVLWASNPLPPMAEALAALESDAAVRVAQGEWLVFEPVGAARPTGFIFYPGGRVDPRAYAPYARAIAEQGYLTVIVPMPLNLAVLAPGRAADVIDRFPDVSRWVVGGHSLGGAMAASFAYSHPTQVAGLVLWAAYPADNNSLAGADLPVVSIYGTQDGLATPDKVLASARLLPDDARFVAVEGGNHAQFGWYGSQGGDGEATISRTVQQDQVVAATAALLESVAEGSAQDSQG